MIGFLMGLVSEVVHSHTGVPTAMPGATPLGFLNPRCYGVPSRGPHSTARLSRTIFGRGGAENAANNEPKRGFIRTPRYELSPLVPKLHISHTLM